MSDLGQTRCLVILFVLPGCEACQEYKPRFEKMVDHFIAYGIPFEWYTKQGQVITPGKIPVCVYNAASTDKPLQDLADQYAVSAMPCTLILTRRGRPIKLDGAVDDADIHAAFTAAAMANR